VGIGVFVLFISAVIFAYAFADLYQGNNLRTAKFYHKPVNSCVCCCLSYGIIVLILFNAPRDTITEDTDKNQEYNEKFYDKYWTLVILGCALVSFGLVWVMDYGSEKVVVRPIDLQTEKGRNPALPRSMV